MYHASPPLMHRSRPESHGSPRTKWIGESYSSGRTEPWALEFGHNPIFLSHILKLFKAKVMTAVNKWWIVYNNIFFNKCEGITEWCTLIIVVPAVLSSIDGFVYIRVCYTWPIFIYGILAVYVWAMVHWFNGRTGKAKRHHLPPPSPENYFWFKAQCLKMRGETKAGVNSQLKKRIPEKPVDSMWRGNISSNPRARQWLFFLARPNSHTHWHTCACGPNWHVAVDIKQLSPSLFWRSVFSPLVESGVTFTPALTVGRLLLSVRVRVCVCVCLWWHFKEARSTTTLGVILWLMV